MQGAITPLVEAQKSIVMGMPVCVSVRQHLSPGLHVRCPVKSLSSFGHGRPHIGANEVSRPPGKNGKIKKRKHAKKSSFLCLCYILRAIRAGRCRERRYADHTFIQIYFRMHHSVDKFSKFLHFRRQGSIDPPPDQNPADVSGFSAFSMAVAINPINGAVFLQIFYY